MCGCEIHLFEDKTGGSTKIPHPTQWFTLERCCVGFNAWRLVVSAGRDLPKYTNLHSGSYMKEVVWVYFGGLRETGVYSNKFQFLLYIWLLSNWSSMFRRTGIQWNLSIPFSHEFGFCARSSFSSNYPSRMRNSVQIDTPLSSRARALWRSSVLQTYAQPLCLPFSLLRHLWHVSLNPDLVAFFFRVLKV